MIRFCTVLFTFIFIAWNIGVEGMEKVSFEGKGKQIKIKSSLIVPLSSPSINIPSPTPENQEEEDNPEFDDPSDEDEIAHIK